jgi:uncharacterized protein YceH (UPF0502 family)
MELTDRELRVLGCLIEKEMTTPDYYPMSLNGMVSASNQRSSRDPVVAYSETEVLEAVDQLRDRGLARTVHGKGDRVLKYKHVVSEGLEISPRQSALLAVLMLRGAQTLGELRSRTGRYTEFTDLDDVADELAAMAAAEEPLVERLPRQPGEKESRYRHLLGGSAPTPIPVTSAEDEVDRVAELEAELTELRERVARMEHELGLEA